MVIIECPICDRVVLVIVQRGPVSFRLQPCGHEVDETIYHDLVDEIEDLDPDE